MRKITHKLLAPNYIDMVKVIGCESIAEGIRREAEAYIDQIGPENVVSITESNWRDSFAVIVWHYTP